MSLRKKLETDEIKENHSFHLNKRQKSLYAVDLEDVAEASIPEPDKTRIINSLQLAKW